VRDGQESGLRGFAPPKGASAPRQELLSELQRLSLEGEGLRRPATPRVASKPPPPPLPRSGGGATGEKASSGGGGSGKEAEPGTVGIPKHEPPLPITRALS